MERDPEERRSVATYHVYAITAAAAAKTARAVQDQPVE
jgi:hypothetical protein